MRFSAGRALVYPNRTRLFLEDDFTTGTPTSGSIGTLGWSSGGSVTSQSSSGVNLGFYRFDTSAVSGTQARIHGVASALINPALDFTQSWIVRLNTNDANTTIRIGAGNSVSANPPNEGIYFEKLDADTNWFVVTRAGSSPTRVDSGVAVDTNFHVFTIQRSSAGVRFFIDGASVGLNTLTIPTTYVSPYCWIINSAAASKTFDVDYFSLLLTGLVR